MRQRRALLNEETGEIEQRLVLYLPEKISLGGDWFMCFQSGLSGLLQNANVPREAFRVMGVMLDHVDFENQIDISQKEIGDLLSIKPTQVSRSIRVLMQEGYLIRGKRFGNAYRYLLSPTFGWKGKAKKYHEFIKEQGRPQPAPHN